MYVNLPGAQTCSEVENLHIWYALYSYVCLHACLFSSDVAGNMPLKALMCDICINGSYEQGLYKVKIGQLTAVIQILIELLCLVFNSGLVSMIYVRKRTY